MFVAGTLCIVFGVAFLVGVAIGRIAAERIIHLCDVNLPNDDHESHFDLTPNP